MATLRKVKGSALTFDEMDANFNEAQYRIGTDAVSSNIELSGKQSSLIIADNASIETSQTVTLGDNANLIVVSPDVLESLFKYKRDGEIVQTQTYRIGGFGSYYYRDTYDGWPGVQMGIFDTKFTPRYSTSKIIIEYSIFGAATGGNTTDCGVRISKNGSVIVTPGYEGYNASANLDIFTGAAGNYRYATYARLLPTSTGSIESGPVHHSFMYCDKPNTTNEITYGLLLHCTTNANVTFTFNKGTQLGHANGDTVGVSTIKISEVYETSY